MEPIVMYGVLLIIAGAIGILELVWKSAKEILAQALCLEEDDGSPPGPLKPA